MRVNNRFLACSAFGLLVLATVANGVGDTATTEVNSDQPKADKPKTTETTASETVASEAKADHATTEETSRDDSKSDAAPRFRTESIRGKVVWLGEALKDQFRISTVPESYERTLAVQTDEGYLFPLVEDLRGRSFRTDERLRGKPMELFVRRYEKQPMLQIIRIYEFKDGKKYQVDYWCDVCAIVMFEKGFCACCQDTNRLRHQLVEEESTESSSSQ